MKHLFTVLFIACCTLLTAQTEDSTLYAKSPAYVQFALGLLPVTTALSSEFSASVGYNFNRHIGLGVEYRSTSSCNESFCNKAQLLGLRFRNLSRRGWLTSLAGGIALSASRGSDGFTAYAYSSGGSYFALEFGRQFRRGFMVGIYTTVISGANHELLVYNDLTDIYEPTGRVNPHGLLSRGIKIGFALPGRGKGQ